MPCLPLYNNYVYKTNFRWKFLCVGGEYIVKFLKFFILVFIWKSLAREGADLGGMGLSQLLTYTLMASVWSQQLNIITPATSALWEGSIIGRYTRPIPIIGSLIAETIGRWWIPVFLLYSIPVFILSPLFGVNPLPVNKTAGVLAIISILLSASLGFALDLLFASLAIKLKNACWVATQVREAVFSLFSGALIPFELLPFGLDKVFALLPFGSVGNAPLSIYTGMAQRPWVLLGIQLFWNIVLWILAVYVFHKSEEGMISYGG